MNHLLAIHWFDVFKEVLTPGNLLEAVLLAYAVVGLIVTIMYTSLVRD